EIQSRFTEIACLDENESRVQGLERERNVFLQSHPDHKALRQRVAELEHKAQELERARLILESELQSNRALLQKVEGLLPLRERELKESRVYGLLREELGSDEKLETALVEVQDLLERRGISRLQLESEIAEESQRADTGRGRAISMAAVNLGNYRHEFNDPNLPYELGGDIDPERFLREWSAAEQRLKETELPGAQEKWRRFFDQVLLDSVKDMINEIKAKVHEASETVRSINEVLILTNFEDLAADQRYLRIDAQTSSDERIRRFRKSMAEVEKTLSPVMRARIESHSQDIMNVLSAFVDEFQKDPAYRAFVTDVRNHFQFAVQSLRRARGQGEDEVVEVFSGSRKDAKSSAQTTQLAYALLASCLAYRFHFHDPVAGADTPRLIILDEFGGKFDNEKPREILKLLEKMGFQSVLVSPMSKADLLADGISHLTLVHKVSASHSKVQSYRLNSREDYDRLLAVARADAPEAEQEAALA
ncbi:MAG: SbcC/MukB-like Walker B domain-containing protein, partial [Bdellovibrionales bacterium]